MTAEERTQSAPSPLIESAMAQRELAANLARHELALYRERVTMLEAELASMANDLEVLRRQLDRDRADAAAANDALTAANSALADDVERQADLIRQYETELRRRSVRLARKAATMVRRPPR